MTIAERRIDYNPPIPAPLRETYETHLAGVIRWEGGLLPSAKVETDKEHVDDEHLILGEMEIRFIHIPTEVNFTTTGHMIYMHDGGEIISGDLAHTHPNYDALKPLVKRREKAAFRLMTRQIQDESVRNLARQLYERARKKSPDDKEAQLADLIDKVQATRFGLEHVFHGRIFRDTQARKMQLNHSLSNFLEPAQKFVKSLQSPHSRDEAIIFVKEEIDRFTDFGYRRSEIKPHVAAFSCFS